jgi:hypothetical protein
MINPGRAKGVQWWHSAKINRKKALDGSIQNYLPPHWNPPKPSAGKIA